MTPTRIIQLNTTVYNPAKDRRKKDWTGGLTFPHGMRFTDNGSTIRCPSCSRYQWVRNESAEGRAILENSTEVEPETVAELIDVNECMDADLVLRALLKLGRIGAADFKAAGAAIQGEEEI